MEKKSQLVVNCRRWRKHNPWAVHYHGAKSRCRNGKYAKRGVRFLLTMEEVEFMWVRDEAWKLKRPSIDRKDSKGHYEFYNCRFIERLANIYRDRAMVIEQYSKDGKFIKRHETISSAARAMGNINYKTSIARVVSNKMHNGYLAKTACGYKWRIAE